MALINGDGYSFDVVEWWDNNGDWHQGQPTEYQMENFATEMTGVISWGEGADREEKYFDLYSDNGWLMEELEAQVDDAEDYYESA